MNSQEIGSLFRTDEIVWMSHFDKRSGDWVKTAYPKVGGRLRLAHDENGSLNIATEVVRYDDQVAVIKAQATTSKGTFTGFGMASIERDDRIAPAILELAETRAIARSLRFAGYGVEYCSAEEISHLENGQPDELQRGDSFIAAEIQPMQEEKAVYCGAGAGNLPAVSETDSSADANQEKGNGRLSNRQLNYILNLGKKVGWSQKELNEESLRAFGVTLDYLTVKEASSFIDTLKVKAN